MELDKISLKLRASGTLFGDNIGFIGDLLLIDTEATARPFAYIVHSGASTSENTNDMNVVQKLTESFVIYTALNAHLMADRTGSQVATGITTVRNQFLSALLGWIITPEDGPIVYDGDSLYIAERGVLWWQFNFSAQKVISAEIYDDPTLDDFDDALIQYVTPETVPPDTDPLPIPDPDFEDLVTTA
jgi:hypothetical protein